MSKRRILSPTSERRPFGNGAGNPAIVLFGKSNNGSGWNPHESMDHFAQTLLARGIRKIFIPNPSDKPSLLIAHESQFKEKFAAKTSVSICNSADADAVVIGQKGQAVGFFGTDPLAIFRFPTGRVVVLACREGSLLNRDMIMSDANPVLRDLSIIDRLIRMSHPFERRKTQVFITLGTSQASNPHLWSAPGEQGKYNRALTEYVMKHFGKHCFLPYKPEEGRLNIPMLIREQCAKLGILPTNVREDSIDIHGLGRHPDAPNKWCIPSDGPQKTNFAVCHL
ncbi:MAG: hypothetical protein JWO73_417 [Candidatus Taylorbacteria bacterium]|nr:hypothetical protein [Candidatus Taylorbacteria bacterium]